MLVTRGVRSGHNAYAGGSGSRETAVELHPLVYCEWREDHALSRRSLIWIHDHADVGDCNPIVTAIRQLRDERVDRLDP